MHFMLVCLCLRAESLARTQAYPPSLWSHLHHSLPPRAQRGRRCAEQVNTCYLSDRTKAADSKCFGVMDFR